MKEFLLIFVYFQKKGQRQNSLFCSVPGPTDYLVATTKIINGNTLIESIMEEGVTDEANPFT